MNEEIQQQQEIIARARTGDEEAFAQIVNYLSLPLFGFLNGKFGGALNSHDIEDLHQLSLMGLYKELVSSKELHFEKGFSDLGKLAVQVADAGAKNLLDYWTRQKRDKSRHDSPEQLLHVEARRPSLYQQHAMLLETLDHMQTQIEMTHRQMQILSLIAMGFTQEEIAESLKKGEKTIRRDLTRIRKQALENNLEADFERQ